jgi:hypothetical protein
LVVIVMVGKLLIGGVASGLLAIEVTSGASVGKAVSIAFFSAVGASIGFAGLLSYERNMENELDRER